MVSIDQLALRGLRAYERGRLRFASRVALLLVPVAAVCLLERRGREACGCLAILLLGLSVWLRWRGRRGTETVTTGLLAGSIPLVAGLVFSRLNLHCGSAGAASFCTAFSVVVGATAGVFIAVREAHGRARFWSWLMAGTIATLGASLGCVRLGVTGVSGVVLGIALGAAVSAVVTRRPA